MFFFFLEMPITSYYILLLSAFFMVCFEFFGVLQTFGDFFCLPFALLKRQLKRLGPGKVSMPRLSMEMLSSNRWILSKNIKGEKG